MGGKMLRFTVETDMPDEVTMIMNAPKYYRALWDFREYIKRVDKHEEFTPEATFLLETIRNRFFEDMEGIEL